MGEAKQFAIAMAIVVGIITYGSLYPFTFRPAVDGLAPALRALIDSRTAAPGRITFLANIVLYAPFGFCAGRAVGKCGGTVVRTALVTVIGALLSVGIELAQYFDDDRVTDAPDVYANTIGSLLGAVGASLLGGGVRWPLSEEIAAARVPTLLLGAWVGYRLFPYIPTLDVHKYWTAVKAIIFAADPSPYDLFRYTAIWLTVGALLEAIVGSRRLWLLFPMFSGGVLAAKIVIVDATLSVAEIAGAATAVAVWALLACSPRSRIALIAISFCAYVVAERLEPFRFGSTPARFGWVPFLGFMSGDLAIDVMAFLQKFFLYGGSIWLLAKAGLRLRSSTFVIAVMLLITSEAERFLPNRSAEITDAIMALVIGTVFALIDGRKTAVPVSSPPGEHRVGEG